MQLFENDLPANAHSQVEVTAAKPLVQQLILFHLLNTPILELSFPVLQSNRCLIAWILQTASLSSPYLRIVRYRKLTVQESAQLADIGCGGGNRTHVL